MKKCRGKNFDKSKQNCSWCWSLSCFMEEFCCYFWKCKTSSKAHWHMHETAILTWHGLFPLLAVWHMDLFSLFLCCFLHKSQPLWLLMRQGWQLKNPDAKLWTVCLLGLWLVSSLASALALQRAVQLSVELGSGLVFCWLACSSGHCLPFKLPLIIRNVFLSCTLCSVVCAVLSYSQIGVLSFLSTVGFLGWAPYSQFSHLRCENFKAKHLLIDNTHLMFPWIGGSTTCLMKAWRFHHFQSALTPGPSRSHIGIWPVLWLRTGCNSL